MIYEHGDRPNQWLASIEGIPECHTFGRGIEQTRARIREALSLWISDESAKKAELIERLPLPWPVRKKLDALSMTSEQLRRECTGETCADARGRGVPDPPSALARQRST